MLLLPFFVTLAIICQAAEVGQGFHYDGVQWEAVGCFQDKAAPFRVLRHYFKDVGYLNKVELKKTGFRPYFEECAAEAKKHNYISFGIQFASECWGDEDATRVYNEYGFAINCEKSDNETDPFQIGGDFSNYIYKTKPVDGGLTPFGPYSKCTKSCGGGGTQKRTRSCTNPEPLFGGKCCEGPSEETRTCGQQPCPTAKPITAVLTGDGTAEVYVDGKLMKPLNKGKWFVAKKYILPGNFKVLAAYVTNKKGPIGFKGSFSNGVVTKPGRKGGWKCVQKNPSGAWKLSSYNDKNWKPAKAHKGRHIKGISGKALFIHGSKRSAKKVWCRRVFHEACI